MDFSITIEKEGNIVHGFYNGSYEPLDIFEERMQMIRCSINIDDNTIGYIYLYDASDMENFYNKCDSHSEDCAKIANVICSESYLIRYLSDQFEPVYILDRIYIDKRFRNRGIGSTIIKNLFDMLYYEFGIPATIILYASDYESAGKYGFGSEEYKNGTERLVNFYKKAGFRMIKDNVMLFNKDFARGSL